MTPWAEDRLLFEIPVGVSSGTSGGDRDGGIGHGVEDWGQWGHGKFLKTSKLPGSTDGGRDRRTVDQTGSHPWT